MKTKKINNLQKFSIYIVLIVLFVACSIISPYFLQYSNLINVTRQLCVGILIAYGEMLLIISGFLDLSVGSVLALAGVYSVSVYKATNSILLALIVAVATGVGCNLVNAFFIAEFNVPAFIATLGMQQAARGLALYFTGGQNILQLGNFVKIGQGMVGPVPVPVILVILVTIVVWYLVNNTRYGRALYAIGGSRAAAEASGINAKRNIYKSFTGGIGTVSGTIAGAFIIGFLENVMNLLGVNSYIQQIIEGAIIVLAVAFDVVSKSKKSRKVIIVKEEGNKQA